MKKIDFWVQTCFMVLFVIGGLYALGNARAGYGFLYNMLLFVACTIMAFGVWQFVSCCREMRNDSENAMFRKIYFNLSIFTVLMYFAAVAVQNGYLMGVGILLMISLGIAYYIITVKEYIAKK